MVKALIEVFNQVFQSTVRAALTIFAVPLGSAILIAIFQQSSE